MKYIIIYIIFIILSISTFSSEDLEDVDYYNLQIKNELSLEYAPEKKTKKPRTYVKYWGQDFVDSADKFLYEKQQEYEAYKQKLEEDLSKDLNRQIVPPTFKEKLIVVVNLDEDPGKIKIIYRYTPSSIDNSQTDFGLEEEQLKLTFKYRKEFKTIENFAFNGLVLFFDYVDRNVPFIN